MITAVLSLIFKILNTIITLLIRLIMSVFPTLETSELLLGINAFFDLIGNALNLTYFMFGRTVFIIGDILAIIMTLKIVVIPVIIFLRKLLLR